MKALGISFKQPRVHVNGAIAKTETRQSGVSGQDQETPSESVSLSSGLRSPKGLTSKVSGGAVDHLSNGALKYTPEVLATKFLPTGFSAPGVLPGHNGFSAPGVLPGHNGFSAPGVLPGHNGFSGPGVKLGDNGFSRAQLPNRGAVNAWSGSANGPLLMT